MSFRPLAGCCCLNSTCAGGVQHRAQWFPSPCGVLLLKYTLIGLYESLDDGFRPLAGCCCLNR